MLVSIVRHGTTSWNTLKKIQGQADPPLNEEGIAQAKKLGIEIKDEISSFRAIFSSSKKRAKMTAELIVGENNKTILLDSMLNSRDVGIFSGMTLEEIEQHYPKLYEQWIEANPEFCPPQGESTNSLIKRCQNFIQFLKNTFPDDSKILIVTHRENLGILAYLISGKRIEDALRRIENCRLYNFELKK